MQAKSTRKRAIGIVRVSNDRGQDSPTTQARAIERACDRDALDLLEVVEEPGVSGGTALERRHGLRRAVEAVETGEADVIVAAYFDRFWRSLKVQSEVLERIERAGGHVLALDFGEVSNGSAAQWLSATQIGMMAEYYRRTVRERVGAKQAEDVVNGIMPGKPYPGYERGADRRFVPNEKAPIMGQAFRMRADGATIKQVRAYLVENGVKRSYAAVRELLASRTPLGEVHFGKLRYLGQAHDPIVDRDVWERVQAVRVPAGRRSKSDRLLARLGVLRCANCRRPMVASTKPGANGKRHPLYRCPGWESDDCPTPRPSIAAGLIEEFVADAVKSTNAKGKASGAQIIDAAAREYDDTEGALQRAIDGYTAAGVADEPTAIKKLKELREARDAAQARLQRLGGRGTAMRVSLGKDWARMTHDERRAAVRITFDEILVAPGRGLDRVTLKPFLE
jgi:DNA invertase Pin-like site-specific DNA recombinase